MNAKKQRSGPPSLVVKIRSDRNDELLIEELSRKSGLTSVNIRSLAMRMGLKKIRDLGHIPFDLQDDNNTGGKK